MNGRRQLNILLFMVFIAQWVLTSLIFTIKEGGNDVVDSHTWVIYLHVAIAVFAPLQAGISDHFCRRKSLMVAMGALLLCQLFLYISYEHGIWWKVGAFAIIAMLGHVVPISRAAIMDMYDVHITEKIGFTTIAIGSGWVVSLWAVILLTQAQILIISVTLICIGFFLFISNFFDPEDSKWHRRRPFSPKEEYKLIKKTIQRKTLKLRLWCYFLIELGFYVAFCFKEDSPFESYTQYVITLWVIGYCFGVLALIFLKKYTDEYHLLKMGFVIATPAICILAVTKFFVPDNYHLFFVVDFLFAFGIGLIVPPLLASTANLWIRNAHFQGKVFGLVESTESLALVSNSIIIAYAASAPLYQLYAFSTLLIFGASLCLKKLKRTMPFWL